MWGSVDQTSSGSAAIKRPSRGTKRTNEVAPCQMHWNLRTGFSKMTELLSSAPGSKGGFQPRDEFRQVGGYWAFRSGMDFPPAFRETRRVWARIFEATPRSLTLIWLLSYKWMAPWGVKYG